MLRHTTSDEMITVACVSVDPYTGELTYASAGHPPPLLLDRSTGEVIRLDLAGAPPFGIAEPAEILESQLQLPERAVLAMYTDGLVERRGANIDEAIDLLGRVIAGEQIESPDAVVSEVSRLIGAPDDDVALLVMTFESERTRFEIEVPAVPTAPAAIRRRLCAWLARRGLDGEQVAEIVLAVCEACNNAIEHGYDEGEGTIKLRVEGDAEALRIVIEDDGAWREPTQIEGRGHGIMLMKQLMHSAEIEVTPHGTRVTLERRGRLDREQLMWHAPATPAA
jgi:anti-sigma regulatory factor (Ser/Thr protein kinase)